MKSKAKLSERNARLESVSPARVHPDWVGRVSIVAGVLLLAVAALWWWRDMSRSEDVRPALTEIPFDGNRAYDMLKAICDLGPRSSGSDGMRRQQELLTRHFDSLGGQVRRQTFPARHPLTGEQLELANLIVEWHPERRDRILLCAHYDTRPYADRDPDPKRRKDPLLGANDGASGVAVLAELGRHMAQLPPPLGVDFVLFDAEEFVFEERRDSYFLGSEHFAREYSRGEREYAYRAAVLLDMVGDADLRILQERHGLTWRDSRPLVQHIFRVARRLGVREFIARPGYELRDDHVPLHEIGGIPACDLIDFEYPRLGAASYWHTTQDTPDKCSPRSLAKVGWVLLEWLGEATQPNQR